MPKTGGIKMIRKKCNLFNCRNNNKKLSLTQIVVYVILSLMLFFKAGPESQLYADSENSFILNNIEIISQCELSYGNCYSIFVKDAIAFFGDGNIFKIMDVTDPANPILVSTFSLHENIIAGIYISDDFAYIANKFGGLRILDISDLSHPTEVSNIGASAMEVKIVDKYAYLVDFYLGWRIFNVSDPSDPRLVGGFVYACDASNSAMAIAIQDNYAYIASCVYGLIVLDISDPANPQAVGNSEGRIQGMGVDVSGDYAYIADGNYGLRIFDVSDPSYPEEIGFYNKGGASNVSVVENYAYVANGYAGLRILDISDPFHPKEIGSYESGDFVEDVYVSGENIYVAEFDRGIHIVRYAPGGSGISEERVCKGNRDFTLFQNHPNPFNQSTTITYTVETSNKITLSVYNLLGQRVNTLVDEIQKPGIYTVQWNGCDDNGNLASNGIFMYSLQAGNNKEIRRMVLMK
jgi:hypothetical protein